jgi:hypothetical protein
MTTLKSLINEELNKFINEYNDEDFVDNNKINLQEEYDKLNQELWGGKLPKVQLKFDSKKNGYGRVHGQIERFTRKIIINYLAISNMYKLTYRQFKNIMAHEQIHVWQMGVKNERGGHGWDFEREARRINGMGLGFNITARNGEDIPVSDQAKATFSKKNLIALITNMDGTYAITLTTPSVYEKEKDQFFHIYDLAVNKFRRYNSVEITVIETSNPEIMGFPVARTFARSVKSIPLSDRLLEQLLNDKIIKEVKIKRNVPMQVSEEIIPSTQQQGSEWEEIEIV